MRRKMLAGNWKMNLTPIEARQLIRALRAEIDPEAGTPPSLDIVGVDDHSTGWGAAEPTIPPD